MPGDMPYYLEKGPYLSRIEAFCATTSNAVSALRDLKASITPLPELGGVLASAAASGGPTAEEIKTHIYRDWFGMKEPPASNPNAPWTAQPPFDPLTRPFTGYWQMYYGDVEAIMRQTLIRGIEVSLGLQHSDTEVPANPPRHWPIEFFWKCGQGWFEGWVTWRRDGASGDGQVTVIIATPGSGHQVLEQPKAGRKLPDYKEDPNNSRETSGNERHQGMWVITHEKQTPRVAINTQGIHYGTVVLPTLGTAYRGEGDIVVVQPSFADGGTQA
jgi:hypothetical protein